MHLISTTFLLKSFSEKTLHLQFQQKDCLAHKWKANLAVCIHSFLANIGYKNIEVVSSEH